MEEFGEFTNKLWMAIDPGYKKIINCLYVRGLIDGTLPQDCFSHYISQDALHLIDDSRALAIIAGRTEERE